MLTATATRPGWRALLLRSQAQAPVGTSLRWQEPPQANRFRRAGYPAPLGSPPQIVRMSGDAYRVIWGLIHSQEAR